MPVYQVECPEFDPNAPEHRCDQFVDVSLPVSGLDQSEVDDYIKEHSIDVHVCAVHGSGVERDAEGNVIDG